MNFLKLILFFGCTSFSFAQMHIYDDVNNTVYNNAIFQINTSGNDIKGFKFPRTNITDRSDLLLKESNKPNMINSMLIYNEKQSNLQKGLYYWDSDKWNNLIDESFLDKLSQTYFTVLKKNENTYSFPVCSASSLSDDKITIGMNFDEKIFTDLYNETTNLINVFSIINNVNVIKIKASGIVQLDNVTSMPYNKLSDLPKASIGIGVFLKSPGEEEFKLISYSRSNADITSNCSKLPFSNFIYVYDVEPTKPSEYYEVKIAFHKIDFTALESECIQVSLGSSTSSNCVSNESNTFYENRTFLPKGAADTYLTTEIFESIK